MQGIVGHQFYELFGNVCEIGRVSLSHQCVAKQAQECLHPLTDWDGLVVDDLQKEDMPCKNLEHGKPHDATRE